MFNIQIKILLFPRPDDEIIRCTFASQSSIIRLHLFEGCIGTLFRIRYPARIAFVLIFVRTLGRCDVTFIFCSPHSSYSHSFFLLFSMHVQTSSSLSCHSLFSRFRSTFVRFCTWFKRLSIERKLLKFSIARPFLFLNAFCASNISTFCFSRLALALGF